MRGWLGCAAGNLKAESTPPRNGQATDAARFGTRSLAPPRAAFEAHMMVHTPAPAAETFHTPRGGGAAGGGALGVAGLYIMPGFPAGDAITAAIGVVSGLAATGAQQAVKQLCTGPDCGKGK